jgi:hypothetical protein
MTTDTKNTKPAPALTAAAGSGVSPFRHKMCELKATAEMAWDNYQEDRPEMLIYELMELQRITSEAISIFQNTD